MKPLLLGWKANEKPLLLSQELRKQTHMHVVGGSGTGKSKALEALIRQDIGNGQGLCLIDWHGSLYKDVLEWCAFNDVGRDDGFRKIILLNPSQPDFITGFNPFTHREGDISTQVSRRITATLKPWGQTRDNPMPTFERVARLLYTFAVEGRETLPNAARLLAFANRAARTYAISQISDNYTREQWEHLQAIKTLRDWDAQVLSLDNRLTRFLSSTAIKRYMGLPDGNIDLMDAMEQGAIVLVNLAQSPFLAADEARVFASLLLNEFFETAMLRVARHSGGSPPNTFVLYLDEFQEYITDDIAAMLDEVRKGGLHMVLAHQHLGHFAENKRLQKSVLTNARIRAVFGGLDYDDACIFGNEMFLPDLNTRQIKKAYYHTIHLYDEQLRTSRSRSQGMSASGGTSESSSTGHSRGSSEGSTVGSASGSMTSTGFSSGSSAPISPTLGVEGWDSESTSRSSGASHSESHGDSSSESESVSETESEGHFSGWSESHAEGETIGSVFVPVPTSELGSESEWDREHKLSMVAETLKQQQQRHCFIKVGLEKTQPIAVPLVRRFAIDEEILLDYLEAIYRAQGALSAADTDQRLVDEEKRFLLKAAGFSGKEKAPGESDVIGRDK